MISEAVPYYLDPNPRGQESIFNIGDLMTITYDANYPYSEGRGGDESYDVQGYFGEAFNSGLEAFTDAVKTGYWKVKDVATGAVSGVSEFYEGIYNKGITILLLVIGGIILLVYVAGKSGALQLKGIL